jgi:hypothetical protein
VEDVLLRIGWVPYVDDQRHRMLITLWYYSVSSILLITAYTSLINEVPEGRHQRRIYRTTPLIISSVTLKSYESSFPSTNGISLVDRGDRH